MAVTIDEMHVDVQAAQPPAPAGKGGEEPKKDTNLGHALDMLRERESRLRAD